MTAQKPLINDSGKIRPIHSGETLVGGGTVTIGTSPPSSPTPGDLWWKSDEGRLKVYYTDVDTSQWVDANPAVPGPQGPTGSTGSTGATGATGATGTAGGMVLIASASPTGVATVTFSSIPATYSHLKLIGLGAVTGAVASVDLGVQINGDSGNNYDVVLSNPSGSSAIANVAGNISALQPGRFPGSTAFANSIGSFECLFPCYAQTALQKTTQSTGSYPNGTSSWYWLTTAARWRNTAAISQLVISASSNFVTGTKFYLYGIP